MAKLLVMSLCIFFTTRSLRKSEYINFNVCVKLEKDETFFSPTVLVLGK